MAQSPKTMKSSPKRSSTSESNINDSRQSRSSSRNINPAIKVNAIEFYATYHGHKPSLLKKLKDGLINVNMIENNSNYTSQQYQQPPVFAYLVGDSSLDNKHWLFPSMYSKSNPMVLDKEVSDSHGGGHAADACNGYQYVLKPSRMIRDVAYWVNYYLEQGPSLDSSSSRRTSRESGKSSSPKKGQAQQQQNSDQQVQSGPRFICLNTAVEESTLYERVSRPYFNWTDNPDQNFVNPQDRFVYDNIQSNDILICNVGGNDIALAPSLSTIWNIFKALTYVSWWSDKYNNFESESDLPPGLAHFIDLFGKQTEQYLLKLCKKNKPKMILIGMIYHLDENPYSMSWAGGTLAMLKYNHQPQILQGFIETVFKFATSKIRIAGVKKIVPIPFFKVLDGKDSADYIARVEPSVEGGRKMGKMLAQIIRKEYGVVVEAD